MKFLYLALAFSIVFSGCVVSSEVQVTISVTAVDGNQIDDARIVFAPYNGNFASNVVNSNSRGHSISQILPGGYTITISKEGYKTAVLSMEIFDGMPRVEVVLEEAG